MYIVYKLLQFSFLGIPIQRLLLMFQEPFSANKVHRWRFDLKVCQQPMKNLCPNCFFLTFICNLVKETRYWLWNILLVRFDQVLCLSLWQFYLDRGDMEKSCKVTSVIHSVKFPMCGTLHEKEARTWNDTSVVSIVFMYF